MKIPVFGATGGLGLQFLDNSLANGYEIIANVRSPEKITYELHEHTKLMGIKGDVFDKEKIIESLRGVDVKFVA